MKTKIFILPLLFVLFLSGCREQTFQKTKFLINSPCEITIIDANSYKAKKALKESFNEIEKVDKLCGYGLDSKVSEINLNAGKQPITVNNELFKIIEESIRIGDLTEGAFDITVGPLVSLWGFDTDKPSLPLKNKIISVLPLVNYKNIKLDKEKLTVYLAKPGMKIDLGGIAQGYAVKMASKKLKEYGIKKALINISGDIMVIGEALENNPWKIGVQHPRKQNELLTILEYKDKSIVTSGDYEKYFFSNGVRYHHIFVPQTGYPAKGTISTTIITDDPMLADALSTAIFVLGAKKGMAIVNKIRNTEAIIISETNDGTIITVSSELEKTNLKF